MATENEASQSLIFKEKIIDSSILFCTLVGALAYSISLVKIKSESPTIGYFYFYNLGITLAFVFLYIFRQKIATKHKTIAIIFLVFLFVFGDTIKHSVFSYSELLIIVPFFSFLVFSRKTSIIIYLSAILIFLFLGYFFITEQLVPISDPLLRLKAPQVWITKVLFITIPALVILILSSKYSASLNELVDNLYKKNKIIAEREATLAGIIESTDNIIGLFDKDLKLIEYNNAFANYAKEVDNLTLYRGMDILSQMNRPQAELFRGFLSKSLNGEKFKEIVPYPAGDITFYFLLSYNPVQQNDKIIGVSMFVEDITALKEAQLKIEQHNEELERTVKAKTEDLQTANEELTSSNEELLMQREELEATLNNLQITQNQLIQSEKMASLGVLSAGIAHEINNPLNFIQGGLSGLKKHLSNGKPNEETINSLFKIMDEGIKRTAKIVKSLNHFSHQGSSQQEHCNLHEVIDNCLIILHNKIKSRITIEKQFNAKDPFLFGNEGKLHQVILNMLSNAEQAIDEDGKIQITTECTEKEIYIHIIDDGCGISEENINKIQDPFFTTKEPGKGTGLGLAISYKIIEEHRGKIHFSSKEGAGTKVKITLPKL